MNIPEDSEEHCGQVPCDQVPRVLMLYKIATLGDMWTHPQVLYSHYNTK